MKWTVRFGTAAVLAASLVSAVAAASTTLTGQISDAMCAGTHKGDAKDCTAKCIKGGDKYVLVVDKKVYKISNQKFADLAKFAGQNAVVTGDA